MSVVVTLPDAIRTHVQPGLHLHFASTPSRSNAAVREVARAFRGTNPQFILSSSGFHSYLHLLAYLRLGRKYIACFFGDNYPIPRPNALYQDLSSDPSCELEVWSLLTYVEALRAGALGQAFAVTKSLTGTDMGKDLARTGALVETTVNDEKVALVRAMRADVVFVHALMGDEHGNLVVSKPSSEGFWSTIGAKVGVIATVEKIVASAELRKYRDSMPIPRHQVLAVAEECQGTHPQPLYAEPRFDVAGYKDDLHHYEVWRKMTTVPETYEHFERLVLDAEDGAEGYREYRSWADREASSIPRDSNYSFVKQAEVLLVLAARAIRDAVLEGKHRSIIAGIGRSYFAARLAKIWLDEDGYSVDVIVETGLVGIECGRKGHPYLLSFESMQRADRVADAEFALGALTCGADNRCLGVVGAGEIDQRGNLNSTFLAGRFLVGSGGANDIAAAASEVIVLTRCTPDRMKEEIEYVTSLGTNVTKVVTELCTFRRANLNSSWELSDVYPAHGGGPVRVALEYIRSQCGWRYEVPEALSYTTPISTKEMREVHSLDPEGEHWTREKKS